MYRWWVLFFLWAPLLSAQTVTGSIVGSVQDPSGSAITGVTVKVFQTKTGAERETKTNERGDFVLGGLDASEYNLTVRADGFVPLERRGIVLTASERLSVGVLELKIGSLTEQVTISAQGATVQTASAERSGVITSSQVSNVLIRGRNIMSLLQLLPGVVDTADNASLNRNWSLYVNGNRANTNNLTLDGMSLNNVGHNSGHLVHVGQDTIAEVKMLLSNYQAEYGLMAGANVTMVSKSGTRDFHGLVSYFKRHEQFDANSFFNNRLSKGKSRSRYNTWNYNVGGPVYIPGKFNRNKDKLFFFWSQEFWPTKVPQTTYQRTVPTALERAGDFSQSVDLNGALRVVKDPLNGSTPFAGNIVPVSRINSSGQALLKMFPDPNFTNRIISAGKYNYVFQTNNRQSMSPNLMRLDYHLNSNNQISWTSAGHNEEQEGDLGIPTSGSINWPQMRKTYAVNTRTYQVRYQRIFSPTLINELNVGHLRLNGNDEYTDEELKKNQRDVVGYTAGSLYPACNPLNLVPNVSFSDVTNAAILAVEARFPYSTKQYRADISDNLTKITGSHTIKTGVFIDRVWSSPSMSTTFNGSLAFGQSSINPLDSGYGYSNALLGNYASYSESSSAGRLHVRSLNVEWFVQDNWKVSRRFTLDYGIRFSWIPPLRDRDNHVSAFVPTLYNSAQAVHLIKPALVNGTRVGVDPETGTVYSKTLIGAIAPSSGNRSNGLVIGGKDGYPEGLINDRGIHYSPRVGFAWDVFGQGKTAVRGGFGIFYNRQDFDTLLTGGYGSQQPTVETPNIYYSTLATLSSAAGYYFPATVRGLDRAGHVPTVMNYSLSVQQNIGFNTVVDLGYSGSVGRHLMWSRNINPIPAGANWKAENKDYSGATLSAAFLRPIIGYGDILFREWASSSNYHSLQVGVNRRYAHGVQFGASWTWSKAMDFNDSDTGDISPIVPVRVWNYGLAGFDRTHVLKVNWIWDVPNSPWRNAIVKGVLNNWQMSGIASFVSGSPLGIGFSTSNSLDITGTPSQGARIVVTGDPVLPKSERTFSQNFRTEVFERPAVGTFGNAAKTLIRGPGINNWDLAIFKNFPVRELLNFQFRWEMYNAFNHTQFSSLDTTARFDASGAQINSALGQFAAARNPRQMQFALRFSF
ncbi:MAG: carboxypeptidase-like regulatory domain-containing protein [Bryobacteraceae bacterium]